MLEPHLPLGVGHNVMADLMTSYEHDAAVCVGMLER